MTSVRKSICCVVLCILLACGLLPIIPAQAHATGADDYAAEGESSPNQAEAADAANSWRFEDGERIDAVTDSDDEAEADDDEYGIQLFSAATGSSSNATWVASNGITSYTYKEDPSDKGISIAVSGVKRVGIDVSEHNGTIDWAKVKADGISFAIIRCGYGSNYTSQDDKQFLNNVKGALENGIEIGVYLYSYATSATGSTSSASEAEHVLRLLNAAGLEPEDLALPVFYDMEETSQAKLGAAKLGTMAQTFCDAVSAQGYKVGIYANLDWWTNYLTASVFDTSGWHKWVARYPGTNKATDSGASGTEIWQFSNCGQVNGINGSVDMDFDYVADYPSVAATKGSWRYSGGYWYWYGTDGKKATGWLTVSGTRYYLDSSGRMQTGWQKIGGEWYYFSSSGAMQTGWLKTGGKWYYLNTSGVMQTGWVTVSGAKYYLNSSGAMAETGWHKISSKWYYMSSSGAVKTGWLKTGGKWYYLNSSGVMQTGWAKVSGKWYYLNSSGAMQTGWLKTGGKWYYLNSSGAMATGWKKVSNTWYYLNSSGVMQTGWQKVSGKWYYLASSGAMKTGWLKSGGKWYYLNSSGAMVTGTQKIGGKTYRFSSSGAML